MHTLKLFHTVLSLVKSQPAVLFDREQTEHNGERCRVQQEVRRGLMVTQIIIEAGFQFHYEQQYQVFAKRKLKSLITESRKRVTVKEKLLCYLICIFIVILFLNHSILFVKNKNKVLYCFI